MKKILIILVILLTAGMAQATWYDTNYSHFKTVTINHEYVNGTVTNHTLLINITDTDLRDKAQADGDDIIFVNLANTTQLDHQIESTFNSTTGHLIAWIRVPSITNTSDTIINMYYNYSATTNSENPSGVWGVNASGIWLFDKGMGTWANDSSSNTNNGSLQNIADPPTATSGWSDSGKIGGCLRFDGASSSPDHVIILNANSLNCSHITISAWINNSLNNYGGYGGIWYDQHALIRSRLLVNDDGSILSQFHIGGDKSVGTSAGSITANKWHYVVYTYDGITQKIYIDGTEKATDSVSGSISFSENTRIIGKGITTNYYYSGIIDSINIYNRTMSDEEIATSYNNTNDPTNFTTFGAEQSQGAAGAPSITSYAPLGTIWPEVQDSQLFNVTVNQSTQCRWYVNGSLVETDSSNTEHAYTNTSLNGGGCNVTAVVNNTNGADSKEWLFEVGADSITYIVLSEDDTNLTCLIRWNVTRIGSNVTHWNTSYSNTTNGCTYYFNFDNDTKILNQTATSNDEELWFNSSTLLPTGIYFINGSCPYNYITLYANEYALINNWTTDQTYQQVAANISNDVCYSYYNSTSGLWEAYRAGYTYNHNVVIPKNNSVFVFVDAETTVSATPHTGGITIVQDTWCYGLLPGSAAKTLTEIETKMDSDGRDVWSLYGWDNTTQAYTATGSHSVAAGEGYAVYCNVTGEYTP